MKVKKITSGSLESNCYILYHKDGGDCLVIDPGYNWKEYSMFIAQKALTPIGIILTHHHHDHSGAAEHMRDFYTCPVMISPNDEMMYKGNVDIELEDKAIIHLDDEEITVLLTPGHTMGSICLMCPKSRICFTGDTIFDTDLGRTDLSDGSSRQMAQTICNIVDLWENDITIYPGHDRSCNMKYVRTHNDEFINLVKQKGKNK